jgi:hypothetical protein
VIDRDKAEVYEILTNLALKALIVVVLVVSWVVMLVFLIRNPNLYIGVATAVLPLTLTIALRHYFPCTAREQSEKKAGRRRKPDRTSC